MNKLIIIEGPQGTGKTTLANYLRENMPSVNLYRLSGQKDKSTTGKFLSKKMYDALFDYLENMEDIPMDLIFDRTFITEEVYAKLGYKEYDYDDVFNYLVERLNKLKYDIYYFSLYLEDINLFDTRLKREHHNYQAFSLLNSKNQQDVYKKIADYLKKYDINVNEVPMDDFEKSYDVIKRVLKINN